MCVGGARCCSDCVPALVCLRLVSLSFCDVQIFGAPHVYLAQTQSDSFLVLSGALAGPPLGNNSDDALFTHNWNGSRRFNHAAGDLKKKRGVCLDRACVLEKKPPRRGKERLLGYQIVLCVLTLPAGGRWSVEVRRTKGHRASLACVEEKTPGTIDCTASISQRSTAQRRWKDLLETELEKQRCKNDERKVCNHRGILPKVKRENDRGNTP